MEWADAIKTKSKNRCHKLRWSPFEHGLLTLPIMMSIRYFDKSELLKMLLDVIFRIDDAEGFDYKHEQI